MAVPAGTKVRRTGPLVAALALLALAAGALAQPERERWFIDELAFRFGYVDQRGLGGQSQAGAALRSDGRVRGSEQLRVINPIARLGLRQNERVRHVITFPVDIVTSASADALDAVSRASLWNEAATLDIASTVDVTPDDHLTLRYGTHFEETLRSAFGGAAYVRDLALDNATLELSFNAVVDWFDPITPQGFDWGYVRRQALNANVGVSQVLSPTTLASASYGITRQWGLLEQPWNSIPTNDRGGTFTDRPGEVFPGDRLRHAASVQLLQHAPSIRGTLRLDYRHYRDDFGLVADTARVAWVQWLHPRVTLEGSYRLHAQRGLDFFTPFIEDFMGPRVPRTADSDLDDFRAHEVGSKLRVYLSRNGPRGTESVDVSYLRYQRPWMTIDAIGIGYRRLY
ncbi:MAG: DUF3570 domain-containing protein [Myxococcota bacterium]